MRILHINHRDIRHPKAGGLETLVHEFGRRWVAQGHEIRILSSGFQGCAKEETIDGIQIRRIGREEYFNFIAGLWGKHHNWLDADLVIEHLSKVACFIPLFLRDRAYLSEVPHIFGKAIFKEVPWLLGQYVYWMERALPLAYKNHPAWVISPSTANELKNMGFTNVKVLYAGVDERLFDLKPQPASQPTVIYVGRIRKYKGIVDPLLKAWPIVIQKIPSARLILVGKGDYENQVREAIHSSDLEKSVTMAGFLDEPQKMDLLRTAWLLVYPSTKEGWGLPVIEAGAIGIPTVASNSPGLRDSVQHEKTGLLTPHGNVEFLASSILQMLENPSLRQSLGAAARQYSQQFHWDTVAKKALDFILDQTAKSTRSEAQ
ncbi:MAG: glycosyltransferase family 4 protein [Verrucomicrobiae bacterium]|nr:glycosyltransferase family 4 protein [Verrucomicrobiae bacterium]